MSWWVSIVGDTDTAPHLQPLLMTVLTFPLQYIELHPGSLSVSILFEQYWSAQSLECQVQSLSLSQSSLTNLFEPLKDTELCLSRDPFVCTVKFFDQRQCFVRRPSLRRSSLGQTEAMRDGHPLPLININTAFCCPRSQRPCSTHRSIAAPFAMANLQAPQEARERAIAGSLRWSLGDTVVEDIYGILPEPIKVRGAYSDLYPLQEAINHNLRPQKGTFHTPIDLIYAATRHLHAIGDFINDIRLGSIVSPIGMGSVIYEQFLHDGMLSFHEKLFEGVRTGRTLNIAMLFEVLQHCAIVYNQQQIGEPIAFDLGVLRRWPDEDGIDDTYDVIVKRSDTDTTNRKIIWLYEFHPWSLGLGDHAQFWAPICNFPPMTWPFPLPTTEDLQYQGVLQMFVHPMPDDLAASTDEQLAPLTSEYVVPPPTDETPTTDLDDLERYITDEHRHSEAVRVLDSMNRTTSNGSTLQNSALTYISHPLDSDEESLSQPVDMQSCANEEAELVLLSGACQHAGEDIDMQDNTDQYDAYMSYFGQQSSVAAQGDNAEFGGYGQSLRSQHASAADQTADAAMLETEDTPLVDPRNNMAVLPIHFPVLDQLLDQASREQIVNDINTELGLSERYPPPHSHVTFGHLVQSQPPQDLAHGSIDEVFESGYEELAPGSSPTNPIDLDSTEAITDGTAQRDDAEHRPTSEQSSAAHERAANNSPTRRSTRTRRSAVTHGGTTARGGVSKVSHSRGGRTTATASRGRGRRAARSREVRGNASASSSRRAAAPLSNNGDDEGLEDDAYKDDDGDDSADHENDSQEPVDIVALLQGHHSAYGRDSRGKVFNGVQIDVNDISEENALRILSIVPGSKVTGSFILTAARFRSNLSIYNTLAARHPDGGANLREENGVTRRISIALQALSKRANLPYKEVRRQYDNLRYSVVVRGKQT